MDIIYGTCDTTEVDSLLEYRKDGTWEVTAFPVVRLLGIESVDVK